MNVKRCGWFSRSVGRFAALVFSLAALVQATGQPASSPAASTESPPPAPRRPSIVLILADDLGYGDLGCYGQTRIELQEFLFAWVPQGEVVRNAV